MKTRLLKYAKRIFWLIPVLFAVYFLTALSLSLIGTHPAKINCDNKTEIYVSTNGVHLDIVLPINLISKKFQKELRVPNDIKYISFGWGDKGFYLNTPEWKDLKISTTVRALFLKSETAMHVGHYKTKSILWKTIKVCPSQIEIINRYIEASFKKDKDAGITEIKNAGYTKHDRFYEATGSYSCIYTCNNWVNGALKKASINTAVWSPLDKGVLYHIKGD
ncbi:MAG TPA: DUF2459 domain-containing protein [Bacteroidetes bacterium]|nr:DUF2459 domain-containing protein [Bacteroidota bacterium]